MFAGTPLNRNFEDSIMGLTGLVHRLRLVFAASAFLVSLGTSTPVLATPVVPDPGWVGSGLLYTFTGVVSDVSDAPGYNLGAAVTYVFLVDPTAGGYLITSDAGRYDLVSTPSQAWFYASYQSGDAFPTDLPAGGVSQSFYAGSTNFYFSSLNGSNSDLSGADVIVISNPNAFVNWVVGQNGFEGLNILNDEMGNTLSEVDSRLTLTSITAAPNRNSESQAVPEPQVLALFALGLFAAAVFRKKRSKA